MKTELLFNKEEVIQKVRKKQMPIRGVDHPSVHYKQTIQVIIIRPVKSIN